MASPRIYSGTVHAALPLTQQRRGHRHRRSGQLHAHGMHLVSLPLQRRAAAQTSERGASASFAKFELPCIELPGVEPGVRIRLRRRFSVGVGSSSWSQPSSSERSQRLRAALMMDSSPVMYVATIDATCRPQQRAHGRTSHAQVDARSCARKPRLCARGGAASRHAPAASGSSRRGRTGRP